MVSAIAFLLMLVGMVLTLVMLVIGVINMAMGGALNYRWNNRLMRYRIFFQFFAISMFVVGMLLARYY